jgi:hypothetical protein
MAKQTKMQATPELTTSIVNSAIEKPSKNPNIKKVIQYDGTSARETNAPTAPQINPIRKQPKVSTPEIISSLIMACIP